MGRISDAVRRPERVIPALRAIARHDWSSRLLTRALAPYNPLDPRRYSDPSSMYVELRPFGPVFHHRRTGVWLISGHEECESVLRATTTVDRATVLRTMSPYKQLDQRTFDVLASMLINIDPPDHTRLRHLVSRAFTPRTIAGFEPEIRRIATELLDGVERAERFDAVDRYATQLPIYVIGVILGLPDEHRSRLKAISDVVAQFVDPLSGFDAAEMDRALVDLERLLADSIDERRRAPTGDVLSALVAEEADGDRLTEVELASMITLLMVAGHETTTGLIANSLLHLDRHRDARQMLLDRPEIAPNAVEELLRFDAPVQQTDRFPLADIEIGGHTIPQGSNVIVMLAAANRDERLHERPDDLLLDRDRPRPLSFGHGIHHCLGAALARLEAQIAIPAFVERFPEYRVVEDEIDWKRSVTLKGPRRLPVLVR